MMRVVSCSERIKPESSNYSGVVLPPSFTLKGVSTWSERRQLLTTSMRYRYFGLSEKSFLSRYFSFSWENRLIFWCGSSYVGRPISEISFTVNGGICISKNSF